MTFARPQQRTASPDLPQQGKTKPQQPARKIHLLHANTLSFDKSVDVERQVLRGDVKFRQDSAYMYCDSAYFYESTNSMEAFSNVRMEQGDTLFMWCDSMSYKGNELFAELFDHVKLMHRKTILTTNYLTYDRAIAEAHYPNQGEIKNPENHLKSYLGWYYPDTEEAIFKDNVELRSYDFSKMQNPPAYPDIYSKEYSPRAILYSDTLYYYFQQADAYMIGPSRIVTDTATVYSTRGMYNTKTALSRLYDRSYIVSPGRYAIADSIYYDGTLGVGDGWGDIVMVDSLQKMKMTGEYMHYIDNPQSVMMTKKALAMEYSDVDTLFLHADTLKAYSILKTDTIRHEKYDTLRTYEFKIDTVWTANLSDSLILEKHLTDSLATEILTGSLAADTLKADALMPAFVRPDTIAKVIKQDSLSSDSIVKKPLSEYTIKIDTLENLKIDTLVTVEVKTDTTRFMEAYYGVRYFRKDMQGVCDSLHYNVQDSLAKFIGNPVMWNESYQITGDTIHAYINEDKKIKRAEIHNAAFLVQEKDTFTMHEVGPKNKMKHTLTRAYDQIKGKDLVCYFDSAKIRQMDMSGNVQVIFYPLESDGTMTGLNQVVGNYLSVWFQNQKMERLKIWPNPIGSLTPLLLVQPDIIHLEGFRWMDYLRPKDKDDVFRVIEMTAEDKAETTAPLFNQEELSGY